MKKIFFSIIILFALIGLITVSLIIIPNEGQMAYGSHGVISFKSSCLTKLAALRERENYYKVWIDKIITPNVKSEQERVQKIFEYVFKLQDFSELQKKNPEFTANVEQHEYDVLVKQYGKPYEKVNVFCNLMAVAGYAAAEIDNGNRKVIVMINKGKTKKFLYFDFVTGQINMDIGISETDKEKYEAIISRLDTFWEKVSQRKYLWGDLNVSKYVVCYYVQKVLGQNPKKLSFLLEM